MIRAEAKGSSVDGSGTGVGVTLEAGEKPPAWDGLFARGPVVSHAGDAGIHRPVSRQTVRAVRPLCGRQRPVALQGIGSSSMCSIGRISRLDCASARSIAGLDGKCAQKACAGHIVRQSASMTPAGGATVNIMFLILWWMHDGFWLKKV